MLEAMIEVIDQFDSAAIAVSGGVDSMTLAAFVHRQLGRSRVQMLHAVSPAVPDEATARVRHWAKIENWDLHILDAGEFKDPRYRSNPVNRCFFCKTNLYAAISDVSDRQVLSGANIDDLGEYRPGLEAARNHAVRHPYIEAEMAKASVRALAGALGLGDIAELPSSPCLASRVETAIPIDENMLRTIHQVEKAIREAFTPRTVRCRLRREGIVIELDEASLAELAEPRLLATIRPLLPHQRISFSAYRVGSAFIGAKP